MNYLLHPESTEIFFQYVPLPPPPLKFSPPEIAHPHSSEAAQKLF